MKNLFSIMETSFENYDNSIRTYLSKMLNSMGEQFQQTQIFSIIFQGVKGICQNIMFYIEDALTEQNVFMASRKKSVYSLARISGFEPSYGSSATGSIIGKIITNNGIQNESNNIYKTNKLYILNHSTIKNTTSGMSYTLELPTDNYVIDVSKSLMHHEFKIVEGYYLTATYTAMGYELEAFSIDSSSLVDLNYITITVDGKEWEQVGNLYEMQNDGENYVIQSGFESTFEVMFGDDIHGKRLTEGQVVTITYLVHSGSDGNISEDEEASFTFASNGYDGYGNTVDINQYIGLYQNGYISGGTDSDSISTVRTMIGYNSRSGVFANEDNFKLFFKRFSFIGQSNIWSEKNSMTITANLVQDVTAKSTDYFSLSESDFILTDEQKSIVQNVLDKSKKTFAGVTVNYVDPVVRKFAMICYVKVDSSYSKDSVKSNISDVVESYMTSLEPNTTFIPKSDIVKAVLDYDSNIQSFDFTFVSDLAEKTYEDGYYNKYVLEYQNGTYDYKTTKVMYEDGTYPALDDYGNISLDTKLEIPIISSISRYYADKTSSDSFRLEPITFIFI